jgi:hypothetical protein
MPDQPDITVPIQGSPAATEPGPPNGKRFVCPLTTCGWYFDMPPAPEVHPMALAEIFGPGVMTLQDPQQRQHRIERELGDHFNNHTNIQFLTEISRLQSLVLDLTGQLAKMGEAYNGAVTLAATADVYEG